MNSECNFYVFRKGRRCVRGEQLLLGLRERLSRAADENGWLEALLLCGELECALEDAGASTAEVIRLTDRCAEALVGPHFHLQPELLQRMPEHLALELSVSTPEGFAYYALHPLQYADVVEKFGEIRDAVVVGIRSIGTTLSAVMAAELRRRGASVRRFTVRPEGEPFGRTVRWDNEQLQVIRGADARALFAVVDEGPGFSGSSFLSVAEGLCVAGVSREQIVLVPSYAPDPSNLRAQDGARRWSEFRCLAVQGGRTPQGEWIGAGQWRRRCFPDEREWPGVWSNMERAKFLSPDDLVFWKFEGLGPYGARANERAKLLAGAGFGPQIVAGSAGFIGYEFLHGRVARREDLDEVVLRRMASYCAFRAENFCCEITPAAQDDLLTMVRVNFEREFEEPLPEALAKLKVVRPTICDGKMAPHEWILADGGRLLKLDATSHGDDHFFPGPCDVAWDLAGAIVDWEMDAAEREQLLREYHLMSGDDAAGRLENYLLAYAVFRFAWSRMAAAGMRGTGEVERLLRESGRYRAHVERLVHSESRCTVAGEKAGKQTAMYSAPPASGVE